MITYITYIYICGTDAATIRCIYTFAAHRCSNCRMYIYVFWPRDAGTVRRIYTSLATKRLKMNLKTSLKE